MFNVTLHYRLGLGTLEELLSLLTMADFRGPASESQRVMQLQKRRERAQEEIEFKRKKLADELKLDKASIVSSLDLI